MPFGICTVPVTPLRLTPAHKSEMVTQLLFGEGVEITGEGEGGWVKVRTRYDAYEGWGTAAHLTEVGEGLFSHPADYGGSLLNEVMIDDSPMYVPLAAELTGFRNGEAQWGKSVVRYKGAAIPRGQAINGLLVRQYAFRYLNTAYLWGGRSNFGIDCSGLTQSVFKLAGGYLPRDAWQQAKEGEEVRTLQNGRCGDLAFFDNREGRIIHVGILLDGSTILHAAGKVRIDPIDREGITNRDTGVRTHSLRLIKRYF